MPSRSSTEHAKLPHFKNCPFDIGTHRSAVGNEVYHRQGTDVFKDGRHTLCVNSCLNKMVFRRDGALSVMPVPSLEAGVLAGIGRSQVQSHGCWTVPLSALDLVYSCLEPQVLTCRHVDVPIKLRDASVAGSTSRCRYEAQPRCMNGPGQTGPVAAQHHVSLLFQNRGVSGAHL
jgi:hypothetical protein